MASSKSENGTASVAVRSVDLGALRKENATAAILGDLILEDGRLGAIGAQEQWQEFVRNQMWLAGHGILGPKPVCIDLQPYTTTRPRSGRTY